MNIDPDPLTPLAPLSLVGEDAPVQLVVDTRELAVRMYLDASKTPYLSEQLAVGDFCFRRGKDTLGIFERKTPSDLNSSILSNRHRQQRQRLVEARDAARAEGNTMVCGYILESPHRDKLFHKPSQSADRVQGALENLVVRDGLCVLPTRDTEGTAKTLVSLLQKWGKGWATGGVAMLQAKKDKTGECVFYHQLCVVPGVGEKLAKVVADTFGCAAGLVHELEERGIERMACLVVGKRKVGDKLAQRMSDAFLKGECAS